MKKAKYLPWQQVVAQALMAVPDANGGEDAWNRLKLDEQRAVCDFMALHCEGNTQPILEEIRQQIKPHGEWRWLWEGAACLAGFVAGYMLLRWLDEALGQWKDTVMIPLMLAVIVDDIRPSPVRIRKIWEKHAADYDSTLATLEKMYARLCAPWWKQSNWWGAALWTMFLALALFLNYCLLVR